MIRQLTSKYYNDTYIGPLFTPGNSVLSLHGTPRFGHGDEFAKLFSYNNEEQVSYFKGLFPVGVLLFMFFTSWGLLLSFFLCMDPKDAGFLSGRAFALPMKDQEKWLNIFKAVRVIFIISTLIVPLFATLFLTLGIKNLETAFDQLRLSSGGINSIALDAIGIADNLLKVGDTTISIREYLIGLIETGFCPGIDIFKYTGINFEEMTKAVQTQMATLSDFIESRILSFKSYANLVVTKTNDFDEFVTKVHGWPKIVLIFIYPLIFLPLFLFVGAILSWTDINNSKYIFFQRRIIMPLFSVFIAASCIFSSLSIILGLITADFCTGGDSPGSPEGTLLNILTYHDFNSNGIAYTALKYYTGGCTSEHPFIFMNKYIGELDNADISMKALDEQFESISTALGQEFLKIQCPGQDFDSIKLLLTRARASLDILSGTAALALDIVKCSTINPIYVHLAHDAICTNTATATRWIFTSLLVISIFGLIIIMFRSVLLPVEIEDETDTDDEHDTGYSTNQGSYDYEVGTSDRDLSPKTRRWNPFASHIKIERSSDRELSKKRKKWISFSSFKKSGRYSDQDDEASCFDPPSLSHTTRTNKSDSVYRFRGDDRHDKMTWEDYESDDENQN